MSKTKPESSFLSLLEAAIQYFENTHPVPPDIFYTKKQELERQITETQNTNECLQSSLKNALSSISELKRKKKAINKNIDNTQVLIKDLNLIIEEKEETIKEIRQKISKFQSIAVRSKKRKLTAEVQAEQLDFLRFSEETDDLSRVEMNDLSGRFNTHH